MPTKKNGPTTCSLIIATYNWPEALELCMTSVLNQSVLPTEIIIADDGSNAKTRAVIEQFQNKTKLPIIHVWHEDLGFRLASIRNKAIAKASSDYIIQIDADIILHPHFVNDHLAIAEQGYFITGSRILLNENYSTQILAEKKVKFGAYIKGGKNFFNGLRIKPLRNYFATRYKTSGKNKFDVKGCNMSFWLKDLILVNGYDESYTGWGREDSNLAIRLIHAGVKKKYLKMGGIQYHIYHKEASRDNLQENNAKMELSIQQKISWCNNGLNKYL